jgi:hypothetical protein
MRINTHQGAQVGTSGVVQGRQQKTPRQATKDSMAGNMRLQGRQQKKLQGRQPKTPRQATKESKAGKNR